jgi:hypothetical protein
MGRGAPRGAMEPMDDPQLGNRLHTLLHGLRHQGGPSD